MYEQRLVAYIDILGWKALVQNSLNDAALFEQLHRAAGHLSFPTAAAAGLRKWHNDLLAKYPGKINPELPGIVDAVHFSDTIVLSCPIDRHASGMTTQVQMVCAALLFAGRYTRGAIVVGGLHHDEKAIFGPALIEAYALEKDVAKYPRILVTKEARQHVDPEISMPNGDIDHFCNVRTDADGLAYVDILGMGAGQKSQRPRAPGFPTAELIDVARQRLVDDADDLGRVAKHTWMLRYLEDVQRECEGHPLNAPLAPAPRA